jgi:hypothetical protein
VKISVTDVVRDHLRTLRNDRKNSASILDYALFYGFPLLPAAAVWIDRERFSAEFYNMAVSVLSVFGALLFSAQVAMFGILQRDDRFSKKLTDPKTEASAKSRIADRRSLLEQSNANISYAILIACIGLAIILSTAITKHFASVRATFSTYFLVHFFLILLLIISRVHTLFHTEYRAESR